MENKNYIWRPVSEYTGGRVLATNDLDVIIGEINSEGDCESEEGGSTILCGITGFIKIEEMLPELAESEDEMIRKVLLDFLKNELEKHGDEEWDGCFHTTDMIAWLENQGEQKHLHWLDELEGILQNATPAQLHDIQERYFNEAPATWSEEDEKFVHGLIRGLAAKRDIHGHITFSSDNLDITKTIEWLDSLKDRVLQQQVQKWSKFDDQMLEAVLYDGENALGERHKEWIKSLKDRVHPKQEWSEEDENELAILRGYIKSGEWSTAHISRALGIIDSIINKMTKK